MDLSNGVYNISNGINCDELIINSKNKSFFRDFFEKNIKHTMKL